MRDKMVFYKYFDCSSFMCLFYPFPTLMYVTSRFALTIVKLEILNLNIVLLISSHSFNKQFAKLGNSQQHPSS